MPEREAAGLQAAIDPAVDGIVIVDAQGLPGRSTAPAKQLFGLYVATISVGLGNGRPVD